MVDCDDPEAGADYNTHGVNCHCFDDLEDPMNDFEEGYGA